MLRGRTLLGGCSLLVAAVVVVLGTSRTLAQDSRSTPTPPPMTAQEFDKMFKDNSNWGRWGNDDELGAANLITAAKTRQAVALVKRGTSVSLAHADLKEVGLDNPNRGFEHTMSQSGQSDTYRFRYHGFFLSHIDSLCHYPYQDKLFNDVPRSATSPAGCSKLGIEHLKTGVITRGVLLDIPRLKGVPYLEPGTAITVQDVEAWEKKAGVTLGAGDALLLYTGRWARRAKLGAWKPDTFAGFHPSVGTWIKARDISIVGSDAATDVMPNLAEGVSQPLHVFLIAGVGVHILDNLDLEALADTAAQLNRWEFMLTLAPIPVAGGTGSPLNPLATF